MDLREASDKLALYAETYGEGIRDLTPEQARAVGRFRRLLFAERGEGAKNLYLLSEAVQYVAIAECIEVIQQHKAA